jgi:hypothetical protein
MVKFSKIDQKLKNHAFIVKYHVFIVKNHHFIVKNHAFLVKNARFELFLRNGRERRHRNRMQHGQAENLYIKMGGLLIKMGGMGRNGKNG